MDPDATTTGTGARPSAGATDHGVPGTTPGFSPGTTPGAPSGATPGSSPWTTSADPSRRHGASARSHHLRCAIFAAIFAPIALSVLGLAVTDLQATAAVGQPLSSSEGMVGLLVAGLLLVLIGVNSEDSPAGMVVTTVSALVIGALQMLGVTPLPGRALSGVSGADLVTAMSWGLYPLSVLTICLGSTVAMFMVRREDRAGGPGHRRHLLSHGRERTVVATSSLVLVAAAAVLLVLAAPDDTTEVAAHGLPGILALHHPRPLEALAAAALLGVVALGCRWSVLGTQVPAWLLMVLPGFFGVPVWMTLTGLVITPGPAPATALGLSAPVITALGLVLVTTTFGVHWTRRRPSGAPGGTGSGSSAGDEGGTAQQGTTQDEGGTVDHAGTVDAGATGSGCASGSSSGPTVDPQPGRSSN